MSLRCLLCSLLLLAGAGPAILAAGEPVEISSLAELAKAAAQDGVKVKMKSGTYPLTDFIPLASISDRQKRKEWQFLTFSGNQSDYDLSGVTIELDTALREKLHAPIHTDEFVIRGANVTLRGLTIQCKGNGKANHGAVLGIAGAGAILRDCTVHVQGSAPYAYGDLFGKGGLKHSGVHITGSHVRMMGCKVFTKSFGHGFYLQEDCNDVRFEDCYVEGVMRPTEEILAETSGMAFERQFTMTMKNRNGEARILPGYMKALSEDGFRTYGVHQDLVFKNCTAKNMRGGFELRTKTAPRVENCTVIGCERGFWVSTGAEVKSCRGDAQFGPLLYVEGDRAKVEVQLLPTEAKNVTVHTLAAIYGIDNDVTITAKAKREHEAPILIGYGPPGMGENMAPNPEMTVRGLVLHNLTTMPIVIGSKANHCRIMSEGPVKENKGKEIQELPARAETDQAPK